MCVREHESEKRVRENRESNKKKSTDLLDCQSSVSYTHLDVYKRQVLYISADILTVPLTAIISAKNEL